MLFPVVPVIVCGETAILLNTKHSVSFEYSPVIRKVYAPAI